MSRPDRATTRRLVSASAFVAVCAALGPAAASAATCVANPIYAVSGANTNVYTIDPQNGFATATVGTDGFASAAAARNPTDGKIYYFNINATSSTGVQISSWDPATKTAGTAVAVTGLATADFVFVKAGFSAAGVLYAATNQTTTLYQVNPTTGAATNLGAIGPNATTGDIAFDPTNANRFYTTYATTANNVTTTNLYAGTVSPLAVTRIGALGLTSATLYGLAYGNDGTLYDIDNNGAFYSINTTTGAATQVATVTLNGGANDLASLPTVFNGDAAIVKKHTGTVAPGKPISYTLTVSNGAAANCTLTTLTVADTLPSTLSNPTYTAASGTYNATSGLWTGLNLTPGTSTTLTIGATVAATATGTLSNTATVTQPAGVFDLNAANNTSTDTAPLAALTKSVLDLTTNGGGTASTSNTAKPGDTLRYFITLTNNTTLPLTNPSITDTVPAGTAYVGEACPASGATLPAGVTCTFTSSTTPPATGGTVTYTFNGTLAVNATAQASLDVKVI